MSKMAQESAHVGVADFEGPQRILMVAYACGPDLGSEPGVGWHRAVEMAKHFEMWVIAEEDEFREVIENYLRQNGPVENLHFRFVPRLVASERVWLWLNRIRPIYYFAYSLWHKKAYHLALDLCERMRIDLIHQSTLCGFREPGRLWKLDIPFIWGPVGGTQNYPWRFLPQAGLLGALKEGGRSIVNHLQLHFNGRVRKASRRAGALLTAIPVGERDFKRVHGVDSICMLDVGVNGPIGEPKSYRGRMRPLRLLWSGVFGHHKALQLLLKALAILPEGVEYELHILGKGPRRRSWQRMARRLGVAGRCTWLGWLPYKDAMEQNAWADVFVFTSLRDTCGTVVLEALSHGLPVICLDHHGAGSVITEKCGIKIQVTTPNEVVETLAKELAKASCDDVTLEALSRGAIDRAREFRWQCHGKRLAKLYCDVFVSHAAATGQRSK